MSFCHSVYACKETFLCLTLVYGFGKKIQQEGVRKVFMGKARFVATPVSGFLWLTPFLASLFLVLATPFLWLRPFLGFCGFAVSTPAAFMASPFLRL